MKLPGVPLARIQFRPRLLDALVGYNAHRFVCDAGAGLTVAILAIPLSMAFAIASGVKPEAGLYTSIVAGFLISLLGGSRVQIGGPAGAFISVVYGIIERYGLANLLIATMLAGVLLFTCGVLRLGNLVKYIPVPIVIGFTNGIAVLIIVSQAKDLFGLAIGRMPGDFFAQVGALWQAHASAHPYAILIGGLSLTMLVLWPRLVGANRTQRDWRRWLALLPGQLVVLVAATAAVALIDTNVETIGTRFGGIPQGLPHFIAPAFEWASVKQLFAPTITIAMLCAIESLLCARVADSLIDDRHDPNQELMAQGISNFIVPWVGGIPATGTVARTVTNVRAGANSPISGIVHAAALLLVILALAPLAQHVPLAALAAVLMFGAYTMGELREFERSRKFSNYYRVILISTFLLTVIFDLTVAVEVGLLLACAFFITRMSSLTRIEPVPDAPADVSVYRVFGSLFFGAVGKVERLGEAPGRAVVLDLSKLINIDTTGLDALENVRRTLAKRGVPLMLAGANDQPRILFERSGFAHRLGEANLIDDLQAALSRAAAHCA